VRLVSPSPLGDGGHGVRAEPDVPCGLVPLAAGESDLVADLHLLHARAHRPDHTRTLRPAYVEVLRGTLAPAHGDDIDGFTERGPHAVVIDARGHDVHEHLAASHGRDVDDLGTDGTRRRTEAVLPNGRCVHLL